MGASLKSTTPSRDARFAFVRQSLPPPHSGVLFPGLLVSGLAVSLSAALVPRKKAKNYPVFSGLHYVRRSSPLV